MTEFITRNYGNKEFEVIIKTNSKEHYKEIQDFARKLIDHAKPQTNADRIRAMSDEELAKFIDDIAQSVADGEYCTAFLNVKNFPYSCEDTKKACVAHVVDWLQQPAEEGE